MYTTRYNTTASKKNSLCHILATVQTKILHTICQSPLIQAINQTNGCGHEVNQIHRADTDDRAHSPINQTSVVRSRRSDKGNQICRAGDLSPIHINQTSVNGGGDQSCRPVSRIRTYQSNIKQTDITIVHQPFDNTLELTFV